MAEPAIPGVMKSGGLSNVSVSVKPTDVSYYFAEYPVQGSEIITSQEKIRSDLPSGGIKSGSSYTFRGPASAQTPGNTLCLVTKDAGGRLLSTTCDQKDAKLQIYSCNYAGVAPPTPSEGGSSAENPVKWPWWLWFILVVLIVIILILLGAYYRKGKPGWSSKC